MAGYTKEEIFNFIEGLNKKDTLDTKEGVAKAVAQAEEKLRKAIEDGAPKSVYNLLEARLARLIELQTRQEELTKNTIDGIKVFAGDRKLDDREIKLIEEFKNVFIKESERKKSLEENLLRSTNDEDKRVIQRDIDDAENRINKAKAELGTGTSIRQYADEWVNSGEWEREKEALIEIDKLKRESLRYSEGIASAEQESAKQLERGIVRWQTVKTIVSEVWGEIKKSGSVWMDFNQQAISDSKRLGITTAEGANAYNRYLMQGSKELMRSFGMSREQATKMQETFQTVTGRSILFNQQQMENIAAASTIMGQENVASAIEVMDAMGSSSDRAVEIMDSTYARAKNTGLDAIKTAQELVKNMSLANQITFKEGVDGISKMTILSQKLKFDLASVASSVDKFSSIEGAIEGSAQLQMLGGSGAMFGGNPMQMMYEALNDAESFTERLTKMWGDQATFNKRTGEGELTGIQLQIIKAQAQAAGFSPDEAVKIAKNQARIKDLESSSDFIRRYGKDSDEAALIENKAQYSKENGWTITWSDKNTDEVKTKSVSELTEADLKSIQDDEVLDPVNDIKSNVRRIASTLVSLRDDKNSAFDAYDTGKAQLVDGVMTRADGLLKETKRGEGFLNRLYEKITDGSWGTFLSMLGGGVALKGVWSGVNYVMPRMLGGSGISMPGFARSGIRVPTAPSVVPPSIPRPTIGAGGGIGSRIGGAVSAGRSAGANAFRGIGGRVGSVASVATGAYIAYSGWKGANDEYTSNSGTAENLRKSGRISEREYNQRQLAARNQRTLGRSEAIGEGTGAAVGGLAGIAAGAAAGAAIGSVVPGVGNVAGLIIGAGLGMAGAYLGKEGGKSIGKGLRDKDGQDTIARELDKINDDDADENIRRIVLPVESIDYNVALIANQLGVLSAMPARGNVYLDAEANNEIMAEGIPLQADRVNKVDARTINQIQPPSNGTVTLNINGEIKLNLDGHNAGKLTAQDVKRLIDNDPQFQRYLADIITGRQARNGNAGRNNYENADNRRGTTFNTYNGGI